MLRRVNPIVILTTRMSLLPNKLGHQTNPPRTNNILALRGFFCAIFLKKYFKPSRLPPIPTGTYTILIQESVTTEQVFWISIFAAELLVQQCCIACATLLQEVSELLRHLCIEDVACLYECCKRISIQHRCPSIAIITCGIASGEDVVVEG